MAQPEAAPKIIGEQLMPPYVDIMKLLQQYQKNYEAMAKCWQLMIAGSMEIATRQRAVFEAAVCDLTQAAKVQKPVGGAQQILDAQSALMTAALQAALANTRDITRFIQQSNAEVTKVVQDLVRESCESIRDGSRKEPGRPVAGPAAAVTSTE